MTTRSFLASLSALVLAPFARWLPKRDLFRVRVVVSPPGIWMSDGRWIEEGTVLLPQRGNHAYRLIIEDGKWKIVSLNYRRELAKEHLDPNLWEKPEFIYRFVDLLPAKEWGMLPDSKKFWPEELALYCGS